MLAGSNANDAFLASSNLKGLTYIGTTVMPSSRAISTVLSVDPVSAMSQ